MEKFTLETSIRTNSKLNSEEMVALDKALKRKVTEIVATDSMKIKKKRSLIKPSEDEPSMAMSEEEINDISEDIIRTFSSGITVNLASSFHTVPLIAYFKAKKVEIPPEIEILYETNKYDFYLLEVNFHSSLEKDLYLRRAELKITVQDSIKKEERKSRFYKIYPENAYQKYFTANFKGKVGIDANLDFKFDTTKIAKFLKVKIDPTVELHSGIDFDLGEQTFRKAKIETLGEKDPVAQWRYHMSSDEYKNDDYVSTAILQIPREAKKVKIIAELIVAPYKTIWLQFDKELPPITVTPVVREVEINQA